MKNKSILSKAKNRITNVEVTVVQMPNIAASRNWDVINFGRLFVLLFFRKKSNTKT
jgi:hypothetical protein